MKSKTTGVLTLIATIFSYIWVVGVIWDLNLKGSISLPSSMAAPCLSSVV